MLYGFRNTGYVDLPSWASGLHFPYFMIRVEGRNKTKRRRYYRQVTKEKIRLLESGIPIEQINAVCRYLASYRQSSANHLKQVLNHPSKQMNLPF